MGVNGINLPAIQLPGAAAARTSAPRPQTADAAPKRAPSERGTAPTAPASPELNRKVQRTEQAIEVALSERSGTRLRIDKATNRIIAQIMDRDQNVIKQIPPEEALEIAARLREFRGHMFDESV